MVKQAERRFMISNLHVITENSDERATEEQTEDALSGLFEKICSPLPPSTTTPLIVISIQQHGYMPDEESDKDGRYWATFIVNPETADWIQTNQRGFLLEIQKMNEEKWGNQVGKHKYMVMKKYKGVQFEAILKTLKRVKRMLDETAFLERTGFKRSTFSNQKIHISYKNGNQETLSIESVIKEHPDVYREAVKKLNAAERKSMDELMELHHHQRQAKKRPLVNDDTQSNVGSSSSPSGAKLVKFADPIEEFHMISPRI